MALRLRTVDGSWVALCAAEHPAEDGDVYLDDAQHYAITEKYLREWEDTGLIELPDDACYTLPNGECIAPHCELHGGNVDLEQSSFAAGLAAQEGALFYCTGCKENTNEPYCRECDIHTEATS